MKTALQAHGHVLEGVEFSMIQWKAQTPALNENVTCVKGMTTKFQEAQGGGGSSIFVRSYTAL